MIFIKEIIVKASREYKVLIETGLLNTCGELIKAVCNPCNAVIISDDNVFPLYGEIVKNSLKDNGFTVYQFVFKNGENSKNIETLASILEFLAENKITRSDLLLALGGGVVGDITGFAASVFLRGISFIQIPTTFLAAIDSSVGGKTAVDLNAGKNLAGSFYQPLLVICDTKTFETLSEKIFSDGICEAVKYGIIADRVLFFDLFYKNFNIESVVEKCVSIKRDIVQKDEFDTGERQLLNFGHTIGHAIEALSNFEISHGNAVGIGMLIITKACEKKGLISESFSNKISEILKLYNIDCNCLFSAKELSKKALGDKKRSADFINLVLPSEIGKAYLKKTSVNELESFFGYGL